MYLLHIYTKAILDLDVYKQQLKWRDGVPTQTKGNRKEKLKTNDCTDTKLFLSCATTPAVLIQATKPHVEHSIRY